MRVYFVCVHELAAARVERRRRVDQVDHLADSFMANAWRRLGPSSLVYARLSDQRKSRYTCAGIRVAHLSYLRNNGAAVLFTSSKRPERDGTEILSGAKPRSHSVVSDPRCRTDHDTNCPVPTLDATTVPWVCSLVL